MIISLILSIAYLNGQMLLGDLILKESPMAIMTTYGVEAEYRFVGASFVVDTKLHPWSALSYSPYHTSYLTDIWVKPGKDVKIGWEHQCEHPMISNYQRPVIERGGYDKIYIKCKVTLYDK